MVNLTKRTKCPSDERTNGGKTSRGADMIYVQYVCVCEWDSLTSFIRMATVGRRDEFAKSRENRNQFAG